MARTAGARFNSALNLTEGGKAGTRKAKTRGAESLAGGRDLEERGCPAPAFCAPVWGGIGAAPSDGGRGLAFASWALGSTLGCAAETCPGPPGRAAVAGRTPLLADARAARRILGERRLSWFPVSQETLVQPAEGSEAVVAHTSNLWSAAGPSQWHLMNPVSWLITQIAVVTSGSLLATLAFAARAFQGLWAGSACRWRPRRPRPELQAAPPDLWWPLAPDLCPA